MFPRGNSSPRWCASASLGLDGEYPLSPPADTLGIGNPLALRVSVLVPRIEHLTSRTGRDFGQVLGHVLAHELGHLLLPPNSHSEAGIMAARMNLVRVENGSLSLNRHFRA